MSNLTKMSDLIAVANNDGEVLGKFVYFSLSNILIYREELADICTAMNFGNICSTRQSDSHAFRSATGDIYKRVVDGMQIYKVFCRDNIKQGSVISRELVKETLNADTNQYTKLANISLDTETGQFSHDNVAFDPVINPYDFCYEAENLFERYKLCAGRKHIETITDKLLEDMEALKISIHGRLYFVPRHHMHKVDIFEDFIDTLNQHNQHSVPLVVNSMYVIDDEKQREKMATEFYNTVRDEIEEYQERVQHLITTDSQSPAIMNRWILKIQGLYKKKAEFEGILKQQLDALDNELDVLGLFEQELGHRVRAIEMSKAA